MISWVRFAVDGPLVDRLRSDVLLSAPMGRSGPTPPPPPPTQGRPSPLGAGSWGIGKIRERPIGRTPTDPGWRAGSGFFLGTRGGEGRRPPTNPRLPPSPAMHQGCRPSAAEPLSPVRCRSGRPENQGSRVPTHGMTARGAADRCRDVVVEELVVVHDPVPAGARLPPPYPEGGGWGMDPGGTSCRPPPQGREGSHL